MRNVSPAILAALLAACRVLENGPGSAIGPDGALAAASPWADGHAVLCDGRTGLPLRRLALHGPVAGAHQALDERFDEVSIFKDHAHFVIPDEERTPRDEEDDAVREDQFELPKGGVTLDEVSDSDWMELTWRLAHNHPDEFFHVYQILAARARGLDPRRIRAHVGRNVLPTVLTRVGLDFSWLIPGAVIVERAFWYPGLGSLLVTAAMEPRLGTVLAIVALAACTTVAGAVLGEAGAALVDPRLR
mgnify:CR=1 FL=1